MEPHHFEVVSVHDSSLDLARSAEANDCEAELGKCTEFLDCLETASDVLNLRDGERCVRDADTRSALPHIKQPVLIAIGERPQQDSAHHAEDCGVRSDTESQSEGYGEPKGRNARQRTHGNFQIVKEGHFGPPVGLFESLASCWGKIRLPRAFIARSVTTWFPSVNVIGHKFCGQFACPMIKRAS